MFVPRKRHDPNIKCPALWLWYDSNGKPVHFKGFEKRGHKKRRGVFVIFAIFCSILKNEEIYPYGSQRKSPKGNNCSVILHVWELGLNAWLSFFSLDCSPELDMLIFISCIDSFFQNIICYLYRKSENPPICIRSKHHSQKKKSYSDIEWNVTHITWYLTF